MAFTGDPAPSLKPFWLSKTFWINSLTALAGILLVVSENEKVQQNPDLVGYLLTGIGVVNVIIRMFTDQGIALFRSQLRMLFLAASLGFTLPELLFAAELKLPASPVAPYTLIRMQVLDAAAVDDVMVMTVRGNEVAFVDIETSATAGTYVFTGPPGVYSIRVKVKDIAPLVGRLEVGQAPFPPPTDPTDPPDPPPPPPTDPTDPPTPPIDKRQLGILILHESDLTTEAYSLLFRDLKSGREFTDYLRSSQHRLWIYDDDQREAQSWVSKTAARPGAILFTLPEVSLVWAGDCPPTVAGIIALAKQHEAPAVPTKVTQVTYVYEKDLASVPWRVVKALIRLNSQGILATEFEEDSVDGTGQTPSQYDAAVKAAREVGLPALVVQAGEKVLRTVKAPTTEEQVLEAAK